MTTKAPNIDAEVKSLDAHRQHVMKSRVVGGDRPAPQAEQGIDEAERAFNLAGAIEPPYNSGTLVALLEHSNALRQNIDSYVTNIDSFGHRFDPVVDLKAEDALIKVADLMLSARLREGDPRAADPKSQVPPPTEEEIEAVASELEEQMRLEKIKVEQFFENCSLDFSFVELRKRMRADKEIMGNAFWEILRQADGQLAQFNYIPGFTMRLMPLEQKLTPVEVRIKVDDLTFSTINILKRFRIYVQVFEMVTVFFKELGDPRVISSKTGRHFRTIEDLKRNDSSDSPATEVYHFKIPSPRSAYGVPRWIGTLLSVLGSRQSEEVNYNYFENKSVPPLALLVSGGRVSEETITRIQDYIDNEIKGKSNFHKMLVLEAESAFAQVGEHSGRAKIELKPLTQAQQQDALFQKYDERNIDKVGMSFRLPRLLRGDIRDFNRACYSADTEVLTEYGWKRHDEVGGERIAVVDKDTGCTRFEVPSSVHTYFYEGDMVRLVGTATDVLVTPEHKMLVRTKGGAWTAPRANDLLGRRRTVVRVATSEWCTDDAAIDFTLPKVCEIECGHDHRPVSFVLFVEFLGYFCSDGGLLETDHPTAPYLVFLRQKKAHVATRMRVCLEELGWTYSTQTKADGTDVYCISNRCLRDWLTQRCGSGQLGRRLPVGLLAQLDAHTGRVLFEALMAGDGTWDTRDRRASGSYYSGSSLLAAQVQALATLLGYRSRVRWCKGGGVFRVSLCARETVDLTDAAERVPYRGEVSCFATSSGFYVTRRNGCVAYQGNTADAALRFGEMQVFAPEREEFDWVMNRIILPELGIRFWRFKSQSPVLTDPMDVGKLIALLTKEGVLTPEESRALSGDVFNKEIKRLDAPWTRQPLALTVAGITPPELPLPEGTEPDTMDPEDVVEEDEFPEIKLTSTDLASVVTVNEVRRGSGLGELRLPDGSKDPDADLTLQEFRAKRTITGEAEGEQEAVKAAGDLSTDNLVAGGLLHPAQGRRTRRIAPGVFQSAPVEKDSLLDQATYLLSLRSAMAEAEQAEAQRTFTERLKAEADDFESGETGDDA